MWHPKKNLDPFLPVFSHFFMSYFDVFGSIFEKSAMTDLPKVIVLICLVSYNICMIPHVWGLTFGLNLSGAWGVLRKFVDISSVHAIESRHLCTSVQWGHCYTITPIWWYWNGSLRQIVLNACIKQTTTAQTRTDCWAADEYNYKRLLRFIFYIVVIYRFRVYLIYIIW